MKMLTRDGVCYNLINSPYFFETKDITFYFSSNFYKQKFIEEYIQNRLKISESLSNRFDLKLNFINPADIILYSKIEKRGFVINYKGVFIKCKSNLILRGEEVSKIN